MSEPIRFYFEFSSPYGYLATFRIEQVAQRHNRVVDWRPFLIGVAMKITGQTPLIDQPMRGAHFRHDLERMAREYGAPFAWPEAFPLNSVAAARAFYWLKDQSPERAVAFARRIYQVYWGEGRDVARPEMVADATAGPLGLDRDALLAAMADDAVKQRLKDEVQHAIDRGIFGSPMFDVDGELFWGCDKFDQIDRWLSRGGW